jgi:hypothetical protein
MLFIINSNPMILKLVVCNLLQVLQLPTAHPSTLLRMP